MPAISSIVPPTSGGAFVATPATLTSSDTITYDPSKKQLLVLRNGTAGALNVVIDGADGTSVPIDGLGAVSVSAGVTIPLAVGETRAVVLSTIRFYLQGVVTITGGTGASLWLFNL